GLKILAEARSLTGLPVVTEVLDHASVEVVAEYADILQVGARNMQNFSLLKELGQSGKPVLIKRGMSATIEEWLMAAEYLLSEGNGKVILCERGIRTFERYTRNTLDLSAVPIAKELSHLPVFVDPSHGTGQWRWVSPMSLAAVAAGADGLIIEVHSSPKEALCDGKQSLLPEKFYHMVSSLKKVAKTVGRSL
ncbi:MAG: 3-deoxy-7-phosphoheptulonate synthase, partial [Firmicutes bacterium]|nr:3-deoxy-7-phosphoheptulonate synthase [Bacillota bacterium]